jgi:hypothetical protein
VALKYLEVFMPHSSGVRDLLLFLPILSYSHKTVTSPLNFKSRTDAKESRAKELKGAQSLLFGSCKVNSK